MKRWLWIIGSSIVVTAVAGTQGQRYSAGETPGGSLSDRVSDAQCENGMLHVTEIRTDVYDDLPNMGKGNHHLLDYALFWSNIRINVGMRIEAYSNLNAKE